MFKWFWTIFSLGAPVICVHSVACIGLTNVSELAVAAFDLVH